jgi:hypothetical protein
VTIVLEAPGLTGRTASRIEVRCAGFKRGENATFLIVRATADRHDTMLIN